MQTSDALLETLRLELRRDSEGIDRAVVTVVQRAERARGVAGWFWRRKLDRLTREQDRVIEALERQELNDQAPPASRKLFLFNLAHAAGIKTNGLEDQSIGEIEARLQKTMARPRWLWKYQYRFWRLLALTVLGLTLLAVTYLGSFGSEEVEVFAGLAGAGAALIGAILLVLLVFDRGLR